MNGKKAKQLRREADRVTVGMADVAYMPEAKKTLADDLIGKRPATRLLQGNCTRKVYKTLKKAYKQINNSRRSVYA